MRLTVYFPDNSPTTHDFVDNKLTVGRLSDNDIQLEEGSVSSRHAEIILHEKEATLRDLGSTNGTFLNGEQVSGEVTIKAGDEILFGNIRAVFAESVAATVVADSSATIEETVQEATSGLGRPEGFRNLSPLPKNEASKDILSIVAGGCAGLGAMVAIYALFVILGS